MAECPGRSITSPIRTAGKLPATSSTTHLWQIWLCGKFEVELKLLWLVWLTRGLRVKSCHKLQKQARNDIFGQISTYMWILIRKSEYSQDKTLLTWRPPNTLFKTTPCPDICVLTPTVECQKKFRATVKAGSVLVRGRKFSNERAWGLLKFDSYSLWSRLIRAQNLSGESAKEERLSPTAFQHNWMRK